MTRQSILNVRHRELGSKLDGDILERYAAALVLRERSERRSGRRADAKPVSTSISALNILHVTGPDAASVIDSICAIDVTKMKPGTARLAAKSMQRGAVCDDLMVIYDAPERYRISHGGGITQQLLKQATEGRQVEWHQDFDVHMLSLQGPRATDILQPHIGMKLQRASLLRTRRDETPRPQDRDLAWRLFGRAGVRSVVQR